MAYLMDLQVVTSQISFEVSQRLLSDSNKVDHRLQLRVCLGKIKMQS